MATSGRKPLYLNCSEKINNSLIEAKKCLKCKKYVHRNCIDEDHTEEVYTCKKCVEKTLFNITSQSSSSEEEEELDEEAKIKELEAKLNSLIKRVEVLESKTCSCKGDQTLQSEKVKTDDQTSPEEEVSGIFHLRMEKGNLLNALDEDYDAIAHCVGAAIKMKQGKAKKIREKYPLEEPLTEKLKVGDIMVQEYQDNYILHVVTKNFSNILPSEEDHTLAIKNLASKCEELAIERLAIPKMGCGLDALEWSKCSLIINDYFNNKHTIATVMCLDKDSEGTYKRISANKKVKIGEDTTRIDVIGDSHALNLGPILNAGEPEDTIYYSSAHPGASTKDIALNDKLRS